MMIIIVHLHVRKPDQLFFKFAGQLVLRRLFFSFFFSKATSSLVEQPKLLSNRFLKKYDKGKEET